MLRIACGSEESKNFEECPESDKENLLTHQKLIHGDAFVNPKVLATYFSQEDESTATEKKMILRNLRSKIRRRVNEERKRLLSLHTSQHNEASYISNFLTLY